MLFRAVLALLSACGGWAQLAVLFDTANQTSNCPVWSDWGPCVWFKQPAGGQSFARRWGRPYREQLGPQCYRHVFYERTDYLYGAAVNNVLDYFGQLVEDAMPCGMCSYQQSCGSGKCHRRSPDGAAPNNIWVAERLCQPTAIGGHSQRHTCTLKYAPISQGEAACQAWPNFTLQLPNVSEAYKDILYTFPMTQCVSTRNGKGVAKCKCCCFPYLPDASGSTCHLIGALTHRTPNGHDLSD